MSKIEILTDEITQNPDDAESYINRGDWYYQQRDFENALYDYEKAVELGEDLDEDVCYLECLDFKRADEKIADFSKKIEKFYFSIIQTNSSVFNHQEAFLDCEYIEYNGNC